MFRQFEEITAWQEARMLSNLIRKFRQRAVRSNDFGWDKQIGQSVLSIMANIAEGNDAKTNAEFAVFLGYAKRSNAETASHLYYGLDQGYIFQSEFNEAYTQTRKIGAKLAKLIAYLSRAKKNNMRMAT